jgi:hypothetical protein
MSSVKCRTSTLYLNENKSTREVLRS